MNLYYIDAITQDGEMLDAHVAASDVERAIFLWQADRGLDPLVKPRRVYLMHPPTEEGVILLSRPPCETVWPH